QALVAGTPGEAGGVDPPAIRLSRALWGVPRATQPLARECHPDATPAGNRRGGDKEGCLVLDVGQTPEARVCPGDGHVPVLSARSVATHCRHHAGGGHSQDPPPSETLCRPTAYRACPFPPSTM